MGLDSTPNAKEWALVTALLWGVSENILFPQQLLHVVPSRVRGPLTVQRSLVWPLHLPFSFQKTSGLLFFFLSAHFQILYAE